MANPITIQAMEREFNIARQTSSDINQHLPMLRFLAHRCNSVIELGTRGGVSTGALMCGLMNREHKETTLTCVDINPTCDNTTRRRQCAQIGIQYSFKHGSSLDVDIEEVDLVFIDTFHVYGQLIRELRRFAPHCRKFIAMHDTTVDSEVGELVRCGFDMQRTLDRTGFSAREVTTGLQLAIDEFLAEFNLQWKLTYKSIENNGLTVLERISPEPM